MYLAMREETVILEELEQLQDGTIRIGNSFECNIDEAILLIRNRKAKHVSASIGVIPDWFNGEEK